MNKFTKINNSVVRALCLGLFLLIGTGLLLPTCYAKGDNDTTAQPNNNSIDSLSISKYSGTGSITTGLATTTTSNLYPSGQRVAALGTITAIDGTQWTVPSVVNYTDSAFPFAPDLYNPDGKKHTTATEAAASYSVSDIIEIDTTGEEITAYIFADNYFELYVNGVPVGKDSIPFTQFNSHIVKFKVITPFTIAMKLVDWEENLGLGSENNRGKAYHPGDGGMVAVFKDASGNTIATTGDEWKAQTFYTAPITDLTCATETESIRNSTNCNTDGTNTGSAFAALHWKVPATWMNKNFDDSDWPFATTFTNSTIGVNNKSAYTNFTDIFDDSADDAEFIWSTNVILDNEVIVRYTVK